MMNRQRLNPLRQQQQQHQQEHHYHHGHEISPRQSPSPQALTVRRKAPCTRPEQMMRPAAALVQKRCVSRGCGKGTVMAAAPIAGDWGTRMAKGNPNNMGRRNGAAPPSRNHQPLLPRVARLATKQTKTTTATHNIVAAASLQQPLAPIVSPPADVPVPVPVEALTKSPYMPSGSDNQSGSLPDQTPTTTTSSSSSSTCGRHRHRIKLANAIRLPDQQNKSFVYLCKPVKKVKELLTARRLRQSIEHMEHHHHHHHSDNDDENLIERMKHENNNNSARTLIENNSKNNHSDPLSSSSATTSSPFESLEILQQRHQDVEHFTVLPNKNYQQMLLNQLRDVRQREKQLQYLAKKSMQMNDSTGEEEGGDVFQMVNRHHKNDMMEKLVCQNIPTLQNEIKQLQQLREKLESTLRSTAGNDDPSDNRYNKSKVRSGEQHNIIELNSSSSPGDDNYINGKNRANNINNNNCTVSQSSSIYYTPRSVLPDELVIHKIGCLRIEQVPLICQRASILAAVHYFGFIKEFRIEMKTLNEIKTGDDTQCFYMPVPPTNLNRIKTKAKTIKTRTTDATDAADTTDVDIESDTKAETEAAANIILSRAKELRSTSFRKLRENPNVLLHQLRPKTSMHPFNWLEQDTMFINSLAFANNPKLDSCTSLGHEHRETAGGTAAAAAITQSAHDRLSISSQTFSWSQLQNPVQAATTQTIDMHPKKLKPSSSYTSIGSRKRVLKRNSKPQLSAEQAKILKEILTTNSATIPAASSQHQVLGRRRQNKPRQVGPYGHDVEPKIHMQLAKTVVVGLIQIAVFLVLIMAFTYPDIRC